MAHGHWGVGLPLLVEVPKREAQGLGPRRATLPPHLTVVSPGEEAPWPQFPMEVPLCGAQVTAPDPTGLPCPVASATTLGHGQLWLPSVQALPWAVWGPAPRP